MKVIKLDLTEKEREIYSEVWEKIDAEMAHLATLSREERFRWYREHQFPRPVGFEKEIDGTTYTVNAHFKRDAAESPEAKTFRFLQKSDLNH